jgi:hypothetical protein
VRRNRTTTDQQAGDLLAVLLVPHEAKPLCGRCGLIGCKHQTAEPEVEWTWRTKARTVAGRSVGRIPDFTSSSSDYFEARREHRMALFRLVGERIHATSIEMCLNHFTVTSSSKPR